MKKFIAIAFLTVIYLGAISKFISIFIADQNYSKAQRLLTTGDYVTALTISNEAVLKNRNEPIYFRGRAKILLAGLASVPDDTKSDLKQLAHKDLESAYNLNPTNLATIRNIVPLYSYLATKDLNKPAGINNVDPNYLPIAEDFFIRIKDISPNDVGIYTLLAKYEKRLGLSEDYTQSVEKVRLLRPDLLEWHENFK